MAFRKVKNTEKLFKIGLIAILFFCMNSCVFDNESGSRSFKKTANELNELMNELSKIKMEKKVSTIPNNRGERYTFDSRKREAFLQKTMKKWIEIENALMKFSLEHSTSKWADDAAFCHAIEFGYLFTSNNALQKKRVEIIKRFLDSYQKFNIEEWTKKRFAQIWKSFFYGLPEGESFLEEDIIRGKFYLILIMQYGSNGNFEKAHDVIREMKSKGVKKIFIKNAQFIIDRYRKSYGTF